jgi:ComF family protein
MNLLQSFIALLYPNVCPGCGSNIANNTDEICISCHVNLPKTYEYLDKQNHTAKLFWGRYPLEHAFATYKYRTKNVTQNLIYDLKYKGNQEVGKLLGKEVGKEVLKSKLNIDVIIPVPLHPSKLQKRGYNQSLSIAEGIQEVISCKIDTTTVIRVINTDSQTRKSKFERWENVKEIFGLTNYKDLEGLHVLIVDDVITTGSTIEGCCHTLGEIKGIRISVVAIAGA